VSRVEGMDLSSSLVWRFCPQESCDVNHLDSVVWNFVIGLPDIGPLEQSGILNVSSVS
jgi:hypothetical protein